MKIQAIKSINTVDPERHWIAGEILKVTIKVGEQLLSNPNFREVKEVKSSGINRSKVRRKRK